MKFDDIDISELRSRQGEKWQTYPSDVFAAWVADMDFPPAEPIRQAIAQMLEVSDLGYPINPRPGDLPTVFCERVARKFDWAVDPERVEVLNEVVQGLYIGVEQFSEPGDGVVIQTPIYPPFLHAAIETGRQALTSGYVQGDSGFEIDFDHLQSLAGERTRVLLFCNPHNPTGRVLTRSELEQIAALAIENDWTVLSDEIGADLVYSGHRHIPLASLGPEIAERTITLMSASKAFNIAGLRCAVAAFGSEELQERFNGLPRHIRGGLSSFGLRATQVAWQECDAWLEAVLQYLQANRDFVADFLAREIPAIKHFSPQGTYLAWLDCRALDLGDNPAAQILKKGRVALSSGPAFGPEGKGFARLNFATSRKLLTECLERVASIS